MMLASLPFVALVILGTAPIALARPTLRERHRGSTRELLRNRALVALFAITGLHVMSWELFTFLMPVHGKLVALSASTIGIVMGAFSAASFFMRMILPPLAKHFDHWQLIKAALSLAALIFVALPVFGHAGVLVALAFLLGLGLGAAQPLTMTLMQESAPPGRIGESLGIRTTVVCIFQTTMPLLFGASSTALGLLPVFWAGALAIWAGVALTPSRAAPS
jgi:predicted MFS family arabinose efflux permease